MQGEFDPEKLIELMKKNGEWDSDEEAAEAMGGAETEAMMAE